MPAAALAALKPATPPPTTRTVFSMVSARGFGRMFFLIRTSPIRRRSSASICVSSSPCGWDQATCSRRPMRSTDTLRGSKRNSEVLARGEQAAMSTLSTDPRAPSPAPQPLRGRSRGVAHRGRDVLRPPGDTGDEQRGPRVVETEPVVVHADTERGVLPLEGGDHARGEHDEVGERVQEPFRLHVLQAELEPAGAFLALSALALPD